MLLYCAECVGHYLIAAACRTRARPVARCGAGSLPVGRARGEPCCRGARRCAAGAAARCACAWAALGFPHGQPACCRWAVSMRGSKWTYDGCCGQCWGAWSRAAWGPRGARSECLLCQCSAAGVRLTAFTGPCGQRSSRSAAAPGRAAGRATGSIAGVASGDPEDQGRRGFSRHGSHGEATAA